MTRGRLLRLASLSVVCVIAFSIPLFADGVHSFTDRGDSRFDKPIHFTDGDSSLFGAHSLSEFRMYVSSQDPWNWIGDFDDDHGKKWGWYKHFHHGYGDGGWNFDDQGWDKDGNGGKTDSAGTSEIGGDSTSAVSEPTVLVLLSAALAAFLLKSLSKALV